MTVRWLLSATRSLRSIHSHIAVENTDAARSVARAIRLAVARLSEFPESGRCGTVPGTREIVVPNLPYVIVYRITNLNVEIIRVIHTSMDWQGAMQ